MLCEVGHSGRQARGCAGRDGLIPYRTCLSGRCKCLIPPCLCMIPLCLTGSEFGGHYQCCYCCYSQLLSQVITSCVLHRPQI
jgi:hypothetical protein